MEGFLTDRQTEFRDYVRDYAQGVLSRDIAALDHSDFPSELVKNAANLGLLGVLVPEELGGLGQDHVAHGQFIEELSRVSSGVALTLDGHTTAGTEPILDWGTSDQREQWLPEIASGALFSAFAVTEPGAGSDVASMTSRAVRAGDDYVINGQKVFCTSGGGADIYVLVARTSADRGSRSLSAFLVPATAAGFSAGSPMPKLGLKGSVQTELFLDDVRIPAHNRLGAEGDGLAITLKSLASGRIGVAHQAVGTAQAALDAAVAYVKERKQFGKPVASFQAVQFQLADLYVLLDASRVMAWRAAALCDAGRPFAQAAARAKLFATEACMTITTQCVDFFGGYGYSTEYPIGGYMNDAKAMQIYEGTSNVQRMIIARELFGL